MLEKVKSKKSEKERKDERGKVLELRKKACETFAETAKEKIENLRQKLSCSRTAKLWLTCLDMVNISCKIIKAQRTGSWVLHLEAVSECLPYFAYLYAKSAIYICKRWKIWMKQTPEYTRCLWMVIMLSEEESPTGPVLHPILTIEQELDGLNEESGTVNSW